MINKGQLIYICDDDSDILEILEIILKEKGYKVRAFLDEEDLIKEFTKIKPDLVLLDFWIHKKNGKEVLFELQGLCRNTQVIFISALSDINKIAKESNVDYIEKPFDINRLVMKIGSALHKNTV